MPHLYELQLTGDMIIQINPTKYPHLVHAHALPEVKSRLKEDVSLVAWSITSRK